MSNTITVSHYSWHKILTTNISSYSLSILNFNVRVPWLNSEPGRSYEEEMVTAQLT